ncbi:hypothetical protein ASG66_04115 [Bacillus sp. Leaf406]|nr:hypothetical protein ASG66_04115 [Bacillus sp. Leaf406]
MKRKSIFSRRQPRDLFTRTRMQLTLFNSVIITAFLVVFILLALFIVYKTVLYDQEQELKGLAEHEVKELQELGAHRRGEPRGEERPAVLSENQVFYYILDKDGEPLQTNEIYPDLRDTFLDKLSDWKPEERQIRQDSIDVTENEGYEDFDLRILMLSQPITSQGELVGRMYIGLDISSFYRLFKWILVVFGALAVLFVTLGVWLSSLMSKRALVPIQQSYRRQQEFVADASHELRTPLSIILSSVEALEMGDEESDPFTRKMVKGLKAEVKRMNRLIGDLLTLARSDDEGKARLVLKKEEFDFAPDAEKILQTFDRLARDKSITLSLESSGELFIHGDRDKLIQLLYILLDNSIKYTPDGGRVTLACRIDQNLSGRTLILSVQDTGIGIGKEEQLRIFDRFYRVDKARTRKEGGHGLGLSIAKWIVEGHAGVISVQSESGGGSEFRVVIPLPPERPM